MRDRKQRGEELNSTEGRMEVELRRRWRLNQQGVGFALALLAGVCSPLATSAAAGLAPMGEGSRLLG